MKCSKTVDIFFFFFFFFYQQVNEERKNAMRKKHSDVFFPKIYFHPNCEPSKSESYAKNQQ